MWCGEITELSIVHLYKVLCYRGMLRFVFALLLFLLCRCHGDYVLVNMFLKMFVSKQRKLYLWCRYVNNNNDDDSWFWECYYVNNNSLFWFDYFICNIDFRLLCFNIIKLYIYKACDASTSDLNGYYKILPKNAFFGRKKHGLIYKVGEIIIFFTIVTTVLVFLRIYPVMFTEKW